jgi:hypothetical protein
MWINFYSTAAFAIKIFAGPINVVSGGHITDDDDKHDPTDDNQLQDYMVGREQQWLDGIASGKGIVKQFVAMKHGDGYTVEAQLTGEEAYGGLQFEVTPVVNNNPDNHRIFVRGLRWTGTKNTATKHVLYVNDETTVFELKKMMVERTGLPMSEQRIMSRGYQWCEGEVAGQQK